MLPHLRALRERIHQEVCERGFNPRVGAFTQYYGSDTLDASVLLIPHVGFLTATDPRVRGTVAAIEKTHLRDGFVLRYDTSHGIDGQFLAGRQLRGHGAHGRCRAVVRSAPRAAKSPGAAGRGIRSQATPPDRELPPGFLAPGAHLHGARHGFPSPSRPPPAGARGSGCAPGVGVPKAA
jgi:Glycosyl hydrolases family 15